VRALRYETRFMDEAVKFIFRRVFVLAPRERATVSEVGWAEAAGRDGLLRGAGGGRFRHVSG
jgi:hypothetical protein